MRPKEVLPGAALLPVEPTLRSVASFKNGVAPENGEVTANFKGTHLFGAKGYIDLTQIYACGAKAHGATACIGVKGTVFGVVNTGVHTKHSRHIDTGLGCAELKQEPRREQTVTHGRRVKTARPG